MRKHYEERGNNMKTYIVKLRPLVVSEPCYVKIQAENEEECCGKALEFSRRHEFSEGDFEILEPVKVSEIYAICKKHGFSVNKKYTRFRDNYGNPWLHIEHKDGFVEWYDDEFKIFVTCDHRCINTQEAIRASKFLTDASELVQELEAKGVTEYNIQIGV